MDERRAHWESVYENKAPDEVSWHQARAETSLALIERAGVALDSPVIDVGGGASTLVDGLLAAGFTDLTVLDLSESALEYARRRLGHRADEVTWRQGDITRVELGRTYALWHDRAVFHFLVDEADRARYRALLHASVAPGDHVIVATFAHDGPERCSGLPIVRYTPELLLEALGPGLVLEESVGEDHQTPSGKVQRFVVCRFRRV